MARMLRLNGKEYLSRLTTVAKWAEDDGWEALLVYSDNRQADPWMVAQYILENTRSIRPLIAIQPIYSHPFVTAKAVRSLAYMYERQVYLNLVAGGFPRDLSAMGDTTPHDSRYERLVEYASIVKQLLGSPIPVTFRGKFYQVDGLQLAPAMPKHLFPILTVSGSSQAGRSAARELGARAIEYLRPAKEYDQLPLDRTLQLGTRLGIIVRNSTEEAWRAAHAAYAENADGAAIRQGAAQISDSQWVRDLVKRQDAPETHPYWLGPFRTFRTSCPFLVGSRDEVATEICMYLKAGFRSFLLEQPMDAEDSKRITEVFKMAQARL